jgi:HTH-type transcriptional regulator/antitoxin HigA
LPTRIDSEAENRRLLAEAGKLIEKGERRSLEEDRLLELLVYLIEDFEKRFYRPRRATPSEILRELIAARGMKQGDLSKLLGSKRIASDVIKGKCGISKPQAEALGDYFHVSPDIFI